VAQEGGKTSLGRYLEFRLPFDSFSARHEHLRTVVPKDFAVFRRLEQQHVALAGSAVAFARFGPVELAAFRAAVCGIAFSSESSVIRRSVHPILLFLFSRLFNRLAVLVFNKKYRKMSRKKEQFKDLLRSLMAAYLAVKDAAELGGA
jgi:uncharacterized membrane protein YidH (DUF202 family)